MSSIAPRNILCLLLFMVYSQAGQCCEEGFAKKRFDAVISPRVAKGETILTVIFRGCHLGKRIKLNTNDPNFEVRSDGSLYALRALNVDTTYQFKVIAKDQKTHKSWKATVRLIPSAKDLTKKPNEVIKRKCPVFYFPSAHRSRRLKRQWITPPATVTENQWPIENPIAIITSDKEGEGPILYSIGGPGVDREPVGLFVINPLTGEINITGRVDRERNPVFDLTGKATGNSNREIENRLTLHIEVLDENDNAPVFTQQVFEGEVEELSPIGTFVLKLNATDADIGDNAAIAYKIISRKSQHLFTARSNGVIQTFGRNLDRETQDLYTLIVQGCDLNGNAGGKCSKANAQIRILDVNDNIPTLEKEEYEVSVEENSLNDEVTRIKVFDKDQEFTDNWIGNFDIIEGNEGGHFRFEVDEQTNEGILVLQQELDYEKVQTKNLVIRVSNKAQYHSSVITGGGGGGGSVMVKPIRIKVNVRDQKEGFSFKPTKKRLSMTEDTTRVTIGHSFGTYPAISADTGKESERTRYAKNSDAANYFNINPETGEITLNKFPDRESEYVVDGKYTATILAIDNDGPVPKTATGTIVFDVDDANDNIPLIGDLKPCMCEEATSLTITANDADSYPNAGPYHFKLVDQPGVTDKWKILRRDDTSAVLQPIAKLWPHTFNVPIRVDDNQGSGKVQNVEVNVKECTENNVPCSPENMRQSNTRGAGLGASAIGLMVLGALLLLLAPLLLLFCNCGGAGGSAGGGVPQMKPIPPAPVGKLGLDDLDGGGARDTELPLLPRDAGERIPGFVDSGNVGSGHGQSVIAGESRGQTFQVAGSIGNRATNSWRDIITQEVTNVQTEPPMGIVDQRYNVATNSNISNWGVKTSGSSFKEYVDSYMNEKLIECSEEDQTRPARECLLVYNYEGEGSPVGSLGSCSFIADEVQFKDSDLDGLSPKFKMLADICTGKFESQASTISFDPPVQKTVTSSERCMSSSSTGLGIIADQLPMQKNYVVTTTINPVTEVLPGFVDPPMAYQNVTMSKQVHTSPVGMPTMIIDPPMAHQNVTTTKQVYAGPVGMPTMMIDPLMAHQNVTMSKQVYTSPVGMPTMMIDPLMAHQNVTMTNQVHAGPIGMPTMIIDPLMANPSLAHQNVTTTKSVNVSLGGAQAVIADPSLPQLPIVHKNVTLNRGIHSGTGATQNMIVNSPFDQTPAIHKNVTLTRPAHAAGGGGQGGNSTTAALVQKSSVTRRSVTSADDARKTVTKVTKVTQIMQE